MFYIRIDFTVRKSFYMDIFLRFHFILCTYELTQLWNAIEFLMWDILTWVPVNVVQNTVVFIFFFIA